MKRKGIIDTERKEKKLYLKFFWKVRVREIKKKGEREIEGERDRRGKEIERK